MENDPTDRVVSPRNPFQARGMTPIPRLRYVDLPTLFDALFLLLEGYFRSLGQADFAQAVFFLRVGIKLCHSFKLTTSSASS